MKKIFVVIVFCCFLFSNSIASFASEETAVFAGGCFWCLEHDLESLTGVINADSGYSGGDLKEPTYRRHEGHQEVVKVEFDPESISYEKLLRVFFRNIDPLDNEGQFCDRGDSYRPVIFTIGELQPSVANEGIKAVAKELQIPSDDIKVDIKPLKKFWIAEDYHQNYAEINSLRYQFYRYSCGRDKRLNELWGDSAGTSEPWIN
tara:strand:- start:9808 stop:10419 length:612 start_codon:yes stop_codon:yes gene_type:complete